MTGRPLPLLVLLAACLLLAQQAQAQTVTSPASVPSEQDSNPAFWQAKFKDGGHYLVKLSNISSASRHEYVANGTARVIEVTIAASGAVVARFYWLEPVLAKDTPVAAVGAALSTTQQLAKLAASQVSPDLAKIKVIKDYPNTTHSHTVEYALQSEAALQSLFSSLLKAIDLNRGRTWTE